ncbi:MAG: DUF192 domain-containing protein [Spirochaetaceae bacterium]|nr:DUF192 domain-containing protein [Spirochaetaceae bacterium]
MKSFPVQRLLLFILILPVALCTPPAAPAGAQEAEKTEIRMQNQYYLFEVAATPEARRKGLMFRSELEKNSGMLFIYPEEKYLCFYMKNTFIPLDIAFINRELKIVDIRQMKPLDETLVCCRKKARYALEANKGFFRKKGIKIGDTIEFITPPSAALK